jgi:predicted 3-demethylubiquinone-9 3-methyltransferase (glyoxalase superfamily)
MNKVTPFLWFDHEAEEAMNFYVSVFKNSKVVSVNRADGRVMTVNFELDGQPFIGLNAGPHFKFNEAVSFFINCDTQEEVDMFWDRLSAGGEKSQCGWLKDRWGLSWQVVPRALTRLMGDADPVRSKAVLDAMLKMKKIVIADLQDAYDHAGSVPASKS